MNRGTRGQPALTPYEWDRYAEFSRTYQNTDDPDERAFVLEELSKLNNYPQGPAFSIPDSIKAAVAQ